MLKATHKFYPNYPFLDFNQYKHKPSIQVPNYWSETNNKIYRMFPVLGLVNLLEDTNLYYFVLYLSSYDIILLFNGVECFTELVRKVNLFLLHHMSPCLDNIFYLSLQFTHCRVELLEIQKFNYG